MNRLFEIIILLIENGKMTADELAVIFEVSKRTILRDLDKLLIAGVPVQSIQGHGGGITIDKSYRFPIDYITKDEKLLLLAGINALDSVHKSNELFSLLHRISNNDNEVPVIDIDLSSWYGTSLIPKIELIKQSITENKKLSFMYYKNESSNPNCVSPYQITFKWSSWYLKAVKDNETTLKMFKLNRMDNLHVSSEPRCSFEDVISFNSQANYSYLDQKNYHLDAIFNISQKSKLVDEYGNDSFTEIDVKLRFKRWFANKDYLLSWLLSFGMEVKVISPIEIKEELMNIIHSMQLIYKHDT
ncbi:helix-turn-helix transcriptional regulator [Maledivibacter halophilus]|uniref:Predicted DNA-binding transcriptional regulator YafY, contains an HTH and WYL domains n=1 Tax=Maledivibacter halophilus TaxID=36842 RepID=A0A1T5MN40_9FIRM|nr:WYL domain-containing protein [Maledivibacter halophilus]SKC89463.1 Predicted DNA-binding transcriptional regulator YafY, contains an HTH and WYL domains [Maledivibacter halophilus]